MMLTYPNRHAFYRAWPKGRVIVEVGVGDGHNAQSLLEICRPSELWLVDTWRRDADALLGDTCTRSPQAVHDQRYARVVGRFGSIPTVHILRLQSIQAAGQFALGSVDVVYVDANHERSHVAEDLAAWWPKVRPRGYLAGHDYLLSDFSEVKPAVDEFCRRRGLKIEALTCEALPSFAIRKA